MAKIKEQNIENEREKALDEALARIQKQFGQGAIMKLGDASSHMNIETISTGSLTLDLATGAGPRDPEPDCPSGRPY